MPQLGFPVFLSPRGLWAGWVGLMVTVVGCGDRGTGRTAADQPPPPTVITLEELRSADYPADILDRAMVRLTGGAFPPADSSGEPIATLELAEVVAIAPPGVEVAQAAVVIRESGGGTGTFSWLHLLERRDGPPRVVASAFLGDRVDLVGLRLSGDTVTVRLVTQGPTDPLCCPTMEVVKRFVRMGAELLEARREP
ncbi:MAG: hypothetical protein SGI84_11205 [Gemmatimonadota bacterium]|nr:hypothetical protein [Gemmatimonadota bacterium]